VGLFVSLDFVFVPLCLQKNKFCKSQVELKTHSGHSRRGCHATRDAIDPVIPRWTLEQHLRVGFSTCCQLFLKVKDSVAFGV